MNAAGPSCREPPRRSNVEASGGPCVALAAPFGTVFVSGSSGYSYIPKGVISNSPRPEAQRDMKTCKELSRKWSVRKMRV